MLIDRYRERLGPMLDGYEPKAIYHSELCNFCEEVFINFCTKIVESGTYLGYTAIRLAKVFPEIEIVTFEKDTERYRYAQGRCSPYPNITCLNAELTKHMDVITEKTAVLIDGPKGEAAIKLARKCRKKCTVVAIHDMRDYLDVLKRKFKNVWHTGGLREEYRALDEAIPYKPSHHEKGLYGKVLATVK